MKRLLQCRQDEVEAVYHEKELVDVLLIMSHKLEEHMTGMEIMLKENEPVWFDHAAAANLTYSYLISMTVDVADMEERHRINIEDMPLNQFMEVHPFDKLPSQMAGVVTYFSLEEEIREMAEYLYTFKDSYIFKVCWEKQARQLVSEEMEDGDLDNHELADIMATPEVINQDIFVPCFDDYKDIYTYLKNGSIRLEEVNQLFKAYKDKYEELAQDLDIMCRIDKSTDKQWIHTRVQQIEQYHELHLAVASAQIIMKVKETLRLQGDFRVLETLTEVVSSHNFELNISQP